MKDHHKILAGFAALAVLVLLFFPDVNPEDNLEKDLEEDQGNETEEFFRHNGHNFTRGENGLWLTKINGSVVNFRYRPSELKDVKLVDDPQGFLPSNETYISINVSKFEGNKDLITSSTDLLGKLASNAFLLQGDVLFNPKIVCNEDNHDSCKELGVVNCDSDTEGKVIRLVYGENNNITLEEDCLTLTAKEGEMKKVVDKLLYSMYGLI
ncbi:MAG: hypothetical protein ACQEP1_04905 [Nanobdellota archaeon]